MSTLLDVLHKRPSRAQLAATAPAPEADEPAAGQPQEATLSLAPEGDEAGDTQGFSRRWTDDRELPATPAPAPAAEPAMTRAMTLPPAAHGRLGPVAVVAIAGLACIGWLAWQYFRTPDAAAVVEEEATAAASDAAPADTAALAPPPAAPARGTTRRHPARAAVPAQPGPVLAWYDQPALPAEDGAAQAAPASTDTEIRITRGTRPDPAFERLSAAYQALVAGDAAAAESTYREVLAADAGNIDALLGLGTLAAQAGRHAEAREQFRRVRQLDPKNAAAAAALSALPGEAGIDAGESQLKVLLAEQPGSAGLHFALALQYVAGQRWPDAQLEFFEALRLAPRNPDYAFNLAVSLDRLGQVQPAASYYQRAIELATGGQQFDIDTARARLASLRGPGG
ncbi:MAG: tetratricopeptide repeat protein [Gammaproteobacteria bacterium]|nr:tetratricopeptide repeat protein [Gammaproteobacteria bacterium]